MKNFSASEAGNRLIQCINFWLFESSAPVLTAGASYSQPGIEDGAGTHTEPV
jgi:hypothetical protein